MSKNGNGGKVQVSIGAEDRQAVLAVISASHILTIEDLSRQLPWMRWGYLFALLGDCIHDGLLTVSQKDLCQFEVKATSPRERDSGGNVDKNSPASLKTRKLPINMFVTLPLHGGNL